MKTRLVVTNSDAINLYGNKFTVKSLENALSQSWEWGTPSFISHDWHRPLGWMQNLGLYLEPGLVRLIGLMFFPESKEESEKIYNTINIYLDEFIKKEVLIFKDELLNRLNKYLTESPDFLCPDCAAVVDSKIAVKVFPEIFESRDKDGLVPISTLNSKAPGIFEKDGLLIFAHAYFRRSQSRLNSLNVPFFEKLDQLADGKNLNIKIALDEDMIGLSSTFKPHFELMYWWGPKFKDDLNDIQVGVTRHEASEVGKLFYGISGTEFWWYEQKGVRTFECEEVKNIPSLGIGQDEYGCRFVHSILNDENGANKIHLDGAIRLYDEASMIKRLDKDISRAGRNTGYKKLWRVDGIFDISDWKEIISHYFRDNYLIGEYFKGVDKINKTKPSFIAANYKNIPIEKYVPSFMESGQGVRVSVSYHKKTDETKNVRTIRSLDSFFEGGSNWNFYVEDDTIELIKMFRAKKYPYLISDDVKFIAFEDRITNFPLFLHTGKNSVKMAEQTHSVIKDLCNVFVQKGKDKIISYSIEIQDPDRNVRFSIAGHVIALSKFHKENNLPFPQSVSNLGDWIEKNSIFLTSNFTSSLDSPKLQNLLRDSGVLKFDRRFLDPNSYELVSDEENEIHCKVAFNDRKLEEVWKKGMLSVAMALIIKESVCSKCNSPYKFCNCSKYMDNDVKEIVKKIDFLGVFWTSGKAV